MKRYTTGLVLGLSLLSGAGSMALPAAAAPAEGHDWKAELGVGVAVSNSIYEEGKTDSWLFPVIELEWHNFYASYYDGIGYDFSTLLGVEKLQLSAGVIYQSAVGVSGGLDGLTTDYEVDPTVNADINLKYALGAVELEALLYRDISGKSDGWGAKLTAGHTFITENFSLQGKLGAEYEDAKMEQYSYGVSEAQAYDYLPAYEVEGSWSPLAELWFTWYLDNHSAIGVIASYKLLADEITDSPLIVEDYVGEVSLSYSYRF